MMENKDQAVEKLMETLSKAWKDLQNRPDQYVVAYYRKDNDKLIGYHASTFCQLTDDLMDGKRYSGDNPYEQLGIIAKGVASVLDKEDGGMFASITEAIKDQFGGLKSTDLYLDAIYLADGMPKQEFRWHIVEANDK